MDCADPARLAAFWALVVDYVEPPLFTIGPRTHRLSPGVAAVSPCRSMRSPMTKVLRGAICLPLIGL